MRILKWVTIAGGTLVVLVGAVIAYIAATFDPNQYKPEIAGMVKDKTNRTLAIDGELKLSFFPKLGVIAGKTSLSESGSAKTFAAIEEARVSVALVPLLSKQVVVDQITLKGLKADLVRFKDGRTNFDDLTGGAPAKPAEKKQAPAAMPAVDVAGIEIANGQLSWRDEREGSALAVADLQLRTGRIANDVPGKLEASATLRGTQPKMSLKVQLLAGYRFNLASGAVALSGLELKASGDAPGAAGMAAQVNAAEVASDPAKKLLAVSALQAALTTKDGIDAKVSVPKISLSPERAEGQAASATVKIARPGMNLDAKLGLAALQAKGSQIEFSKFDLDFLLKQAEQTLQGKLASPVSLDLDKTQVQLPKLAGELTVAGPKVPNKSMRLALHGSAGANWGKQTATASLAVKSDETNGEAKLNVTKFSPLALGFSVALDRLNLDRYLPPKSAAAPDDSVEKPIDLSALKTLNMTGQIRVGHLVVSNVKLDNLQVGLKCAGGRLDVSPLAANLYQGSMSGAASVDANASRFALKQALSNVAIGPLLRDAADKDLLEGRGNVALDVHAAGNLASALKKTLGGSANLQLKDGAIKGVDLAGIVQKARSLTGKSAPEDSTGKGAKTDFTELTATFQIANGVATNRDLSAKAPLIRLAGEGTINLVTDSMDYLAKPTLVATSRGQGGRERQDLTGITVPVRISGPFANLSYRPDFSAAAAEIAKGKLGEVVQGATGQAKEQAKEQVKEQVKDRLKGLFGR